MDGMGLSLARWIDRGWRHENISVFRWTNVDAQAEPAIAALKREKLSGLPMPG
jgi:hypothetical protein